jgi:hypothetical protein
MKRDDRQALLSLSREDLLKKLRELAIQLIRARQEKLLQDRSQVDIKRAYKIRKQIKMIKAQLRSQELTMAEKSE